VLPGKVAIGHNRYSTCGSSLLKNAQPLVLDYVGGSVAVAHNGNLVNAHGLRKELEGARAVFRSTSDSEIIVQLIALSNAPSIVGRIREALERVSGAYSLLFLTDGALIAVRDPHAFRPLCLASLGDSLVVSSETCALDLIGGEYTREIGPGELLIAGKNGVQSVQLFPPGRLAHCIFEFIYFARPDSRIFGRSVNMVRKELGRQLAREHAIDADVVVPVPDSGVTAALGFAEESGIRFEVGLIRNHYVGRTFIEPSQSIRHFGVKVKLNPVREIIGGKRVIVVDDSIVRGTTSRKIVEMVRNAGAREVHMCISSPPTRFPCFYGIDTPTQNELIASR